MDTIYKIQKEVLHHCTSLKERDNDVEMCFSQMTTPSSGWGERTCEKQPPILVKISNDKKFKNSFADLIISSKDLKVVHIIVH